MPDLATSGRHVGQTGRPPPGSMRRVQRCRLEAVSIMPTHVLRRRPAIALILLATIACAIGRASADDPTAHLDVYRTFERPDGAFRIVVLRRPLSFAMPGQAGDAPGIVQLVNRKGQVLRQTEVEMAQFVNENTIEWSRNAVHIKLVVDWTLP